MRSLALACLMLLSACATPRRRGPNEALAEGRAALRSPDASARAQAAWHLGQLGLTELPDGAPEPAAAASLREAATAALIPSVSDADPAVRRSAVEALGKVGGPANENILISAGTDIDGGVRGEVAMALFRTRFLKRAPEYSTAALNKLLTLAIDSDPEVRWRAIYAFSRYPEERAAKTLTQAVKDPDKVTRLFAVRSLSKLASRVDVSLLGDPDLYVRAEAAAAFGAAKAAGELPSSVYDDPSAHVRAAAADAVASTGDPALAPLLEKMADSDTPMPRGRALLALAKLRGAAESARLSRARKDPHWWVRSRAFEASFFLPDAGEILSRGVLDPDPRVSAQALETLSSSTAPAAAAAIERVLLDPKAQLEPLGTAIDAAAERKSPSFAAALQASWARADLTAELRDSLRKALKASGVEVKAGPPLDAPKTFPPLPSSPILVLETEKGVVELLLDASVAPNTASAIADAARRGVYDGAIWHRVVTGFVVQGGDPRGSGWGDDGFRLVDEVNRLPFLRGTLGMPKAGPDTGGCQLFVSLVPTPHLDGRYTAFGRVILGMDVLDALEPGDKILKARLQAEAKAGSPRFAARMSRIEKKVGDLTALSDLFASEDFIQVHEGPKKHVDDALAFLADSAAGETRKLIAAYSMQDLPLADYLAFVNAVLELRKAGRVSAKVYRHAVLPTLEWSVKLQENYKEPAVAAFLSKVRAAAVSAEDKDNVEYIDHILSGGSAADVRAMREGGQLKQR